MNLIKFPNCVYGLPQVVLKAHEPEIDIRMIVGPTVWERSHRCSVRGVAVEKIGRGVPDDRGISYVWCRFPDGRVMLVNEGNIRVKKLNRSEYSVVKAA